MGNQGIFLTGRLTTEDISKSKRTGCSREHHIKEIEKAVEHKTESDSTPNIQNQTVTLLNTMSRLAPQVEEMLNEDISVVSVIMLPNVYSVKDFLHLAKCSSQSTELREIIVVYNLSQRTPKVTISKEKYINVLAELVVSNIDDGDILCVPRIGRGIVRTREITVDNKVKVDYTLVFKGSMSGMKKVSKAWLSDTYSKGIRELHLKELCETNGLVIVMVNSMTSLMVDILESAGDAIYSREYVENNLCIRWDYLVDLGVVSR